MSFTMPGREDWQGRSSNNEVIFASEIVTRNHQQMRYKLGYAPVSEALETAKQRLVALAGRLKRYTKEVELCNINRLLSTDASKVHSMLRGDSRHG